MNSKIFILNGTATCGKDTFADMVKENTSAVHYSIIKPITDILSGLPKEVQVDMSNKDERLRKLISDIKLALEEYSDYPYRKVKNFIEYANGKWEFIFIDMREAHNIERLKKEYGAKSVLITNKRAPKITSNIADAQVDEIDYDIKIDNNGTLEDLRKEVVEFIKQNS